MTSNLGLAVGSRCRAQLCCWASSSSWWDEQKWPLLMWVRGENPLRRWAGVQVKESQLWVTPYSLRSADNPEEKSLIAFPPLTHRLLLLSKMQKCSKMGLKHMFSSGLYLVLRRQHSVKQKSFQIQIISIRKSNRPQVDCCSLCHKDLCKLT